MARLLSRVECLAFDLLTTESLRLSLRQSKDTLSPGAVKDPLTRRRIASLSFGALRLEAGISDLDVEAPRTAGHYKDSATDPLEISLEPCNAPRFTRHMRRDSQAPVIPSLSRNRRREKMGPYRESTVKTPAFVFATLRCTSRRRIAGSWWRGNPRVYPKHTRSPRKTLALLRTSECPGPSRLALG
jgi:hypothetical protein